jgi:serine/threonine protein kinase
MKFLKVFMCRKEQKVVAWKANTPALHTGVGRRPLWPGRSGRPIVVRTFRDRVDMMVDLRTRLQATLGTAYTLERELGGGGMSRVFVAHDDSLGRNVVVKVLSPELAAGVTAQRFRRRR